MVSQDKSMSVILLAISLVLLIFFLPWLMEKQETLSVEQDTKNMEIIQTEQLFVEKRKQKDEFDKMTLFEREKILKRIPEKMEQETIMQELNDTARKYGFTITSLSFTEEERVGSLGKLTLTTHFKGSANTLSTASFIKALETTQRLFVIRSFSLLFGQSSSDFSFTLEAYYQI